MQVSTERPATAARSALERIAGDGAPPAAVWDAAALAWVPEVYGAARYHLIGLDHDGTAHPLAGTLSEAELPAPLLEVLEAAATWERVAALGPGAALPIAALQSAPPEASPLVGRFLREESEPRGVLLLCPPAASGAGEPPATSQLALQLGDRHLASLIRMWLLARERGWLSEFTRALLGVQRRGVIAVDAQGGVVYLSPLGAEILGVDAAQAVGSDCTRVLRPTAAGEHPLLAGLAGRLEGIECYVRDARGRDLPLSLRMRRMSGSDGSATGLVGLFRDLSVERAFDQEARRRERLAVIGELAAGVAHEIRNPLTGIGNCAQVLQERLAGEENNRRMADLILRETQRLDRIVTSLLGFARPGPPRMRETQVEAVVRTSLELEHAAREKAGVRLELHVIGRLPAIYADPEQLQQVFGNLIRNALQAMADGGELTIELEVVRRPLHPRRGLGRRATDRVHIPRSAPQGRFVRVRFSDTGPGIPAEIQARIFDPFFTTRSGGTGLGLSVSQSIIQEHGGSISVQSGPGAGAVFEIDLPVERRHGERRKDA